MSVLNPVLQPTEVKEYLCKGDRFIKWDDETSNASPVILRVDPQGFYVYWTYQSTEREILDITSIRDTRAGRFAKMPKKLYPDLRPGPFVPAVFEQYNFLWTANKWPL